MKKAVISILVILPLLLVVIIAIAGRIYGSVEYVNVEEVYFVDDNESPIDSKEIDVGENYQLKYIITPSLATNKNITFSSDNNNICSVSSQGLITGISEGQTNIVAKSINNIEARITVTVKSTGSTSISISTTSITGTLGCKAIITALANPSSQTQYITWSSSNSNIVSISGQGGIATLSFNGLGIAVITATSQDGRNAICEVVVTENGISFTQETMTSNENTINLYEYIKNYESQVIHFEITGGSATIENGVLTMNRVGITRVKMYNNGDNSNENLNYDEITIIFI